FVVAAMAVNLFSAYGRGKIGARALPAPVLPGCRAPANVVTSSVSLGWRVWIERNPLRRVRRTDNEVGRSLSEVDGPGPVERAGRARCRPGNPARSPGSGRQPGGGARPLQARGRPRDRSRASPIDRARATGR